jgi:hypothetical protein
LVLSGTLREFILADVFQLLAQQKITGKLILTSGRNQGMVIFKNGLVAGAEKDDEHFSSKLFNYLVNFKNLEAPKVQELFTLCEGDLGELSRRIENSNLLSSQELVSFAESVVEDITCSMFLWKTGTYRFNSLKTVDTLNPADISIPVENIVMEAMRRMDEWARMREVISHDSIFVKVQKSDSHLDDIPDPFERTVDYVYARINGISPVTEIIKDSCLTEYKIYEALNSLLIAEKITPLSEKITRSVQAALEKKVHDKESSSFSILYSILATIGVILLILLISWFFGIHSGKSSGGYYMNNGFQISMAPNENIAKKNNMDQVSAFLQN